MTTFDEAAHPRAKTGNTGQFTNKEHADSGLTLDPAAFVVTCERCQITDAVPGTFECAGCAEPGYTPFFDETPPAKEAYKDPFPGRGGTEPEFDPCDRCGGEGYLEQFKHGMNGGICFKCDGSKGVMSTVDALREKEKNKVRVRNRRASALHKDRILHNANYRKAIEVNPLAAGWRYRTGSDMFLADLWAKAFKRDLSERQLAAIGRSFERDMEYQARKKAEKEAVTDVVEGRGEISGRVIKTSIKTTQWGSTLKMTVKDDRGFKIHGAVPPNLQEEYWANTADLAGRRVKFKATVKSGDEKGFGFFTRPVDAAFEE